MSGRLPLCGAHWVDHLARHARGRGSQTALSFGDRSLTWSQLHVRVQRLAGALAARGVVRGDRVAVLMTNRLEVLESTFAANALGAIAVPINFRLARDEVRYIVEDSGARIVLTDPGLLDTALSAMPEGSCVVVGDASGRCESYDDLLAEYNMPPDVDIDEHDVALIMYTSGTTGRPKGAMLTHLNLLLQAVGMIRTHRLFDDREVYLLNVPLFHVAGVGTMPAPMLNGTQTVVMPTGAFDAGATLDVIEKEGVTSMFLVPAQWRELCAHPDVTRRTRSLRTVSWGGAPADSELLRRMGEVLPHADVVSVFGQTEMSPPCASLSAAEALRKPGTVGRPLPTIVTRVVDDEMRDVAFGTVGEIVYRGPTLMVGYWNDAERTDEAFDSGWFHSGDLVSADNEGYLTVVDRKKDMIISGGENVYCAEVEDALAGHPAVFEVTVIGEPHERWGETPVAVVVPVDPQEPPSLEDLRSFARDRLASYKMPTRVTMRRSLPRNAAGKILKHVLRQEVSDPMGDDA